MKKIDLNLTTAFTLRKRIKEISTRLHRELATVRYMDEPERFMNLCIDFLKN